MHDITNTTAKRLNESLHLPVLVIIEPLLLPRTCILSVLRRELDELEILDMATVQSLGCASARDVRLVVLSIAGKSIGDPSVEDDLAFVAECCPNAAVAVLSNHDDEPTVQAAMQRGVRGFLSTSLPIEIAIAGLRLVLVGGVYRPLPVAGMTRVPDFEPPDARGLAPAYLMSDGTGRAIDKSVADFTPRERQILAELELGLPNKLIAAKLSLSESTVKMHIQHIMRKCAAHNRTEAVLRWRGRLPAQGRDHDPGTAPMSET
ncbi:response regulator transcription factor [Bradyrhizobium sp. Gha]|uniref:response regulator transcription factor n=1 Tax=Bradyrhizobium sp. Gha TaxID=1855318 RepID=UPI0008F2C2DA|nr:response regulator transcription factor [Bradyrhizobium sp. Gha]SFJ44657.1 DNA-binding response regulator, NarL/FixJ family, contains REC and HTH domains [Bradyrhizobium sp. Gha]